MRVLPRVFSIGTLALLSLAAASSPARAELGLHAATHFGVGAMGTENPAEPNRSMGTFDLQAMPGWRFPNSKFMAGMLIDYRFMTQLEEGVPITGETNFAGQSVHFGIGGTFETGDLKLLATFDPLARHWAAVPTTTFKGSGLHLLAGIQFEPNWYIDIEYSEATYDEAGIMGRDQHLDPPNRHWNLGLGISYSY
ncbi:MAG: hypothetical protein EOP11_10315 [Proteobacteria bacterium]|nr:MAG: hypothetical protein EOP11_10315 [Pseudomonadota bacterium]